MKITLEKIDKLKYNKTINYLKFHENITLRISLK